MEVYKTRWFARFARQELITDSSLREAILRAERGLIDADFGGGLIKQRVAGRDRVDPAAIAQSSPIVAGIELSSSTDSPKASERTSNATRSSLLAGLRIIGFRPMHQKFASALMTTQYRRLKMPKKNSRIVEAILETARDLHRLGMMDDEEYRKITVRHLGPQPLPTAKPISSREIRKIREKANLSQAAFARYLNLTSGYVSQLERGTKQPKGPALALLNVIRRKGFEAIL
jgi:putative transcriptional regulator